MQALDHDRLGDFLFDELPQSHPRDGRQGRLGRCGQRRQDERDGDDDELEPGRGVQWDLLEELTDGTILVDAEDRLGEQWRDGKNFYLRMLLFRRQRDGVRDHDFFDGRVDQLRHGITGEHAVGSKDPNAGRAFGAQRVRNADQRAARRYQVIDDDGVHAVDIADHALLTDDVVLGAPLVNERDRQIEQPRDVADALGAAAIRRHDPRIGPVQLAGG